jgi:hypothetical protein
MKHIGLFAALLCAAFLAFGSQARASVFCPADVAFMTPWDFSTDGPSKGDDSLHYFFSLSGDEPSTISGDMIVVTDSKAYTVPFKDVHILRSLTDPKRFESDAAFLSLPQHDAIRYAWVDDVTDSSGKHSDCPTFPYHLQPLTADERADLTPEHPHPIKGPYSVQSLQAQFKMNLDPVKCDKPFANPEPTDSISQTYNFYDPSVVRNPHVEGRVDIDSNGNPVNVELTKPSGAVSLDAYVREWYGSAKYRPAIFRCVGVVSSYYFEVTYGDR